jgi:hypothetical protein
MLAKLLTLLSTAKGAAAVAVIAAAGVTTAVVATSSDVQHALGNAVETRTPAASESPDASGSGKPAVVAARNDADTRLRDAFRDDQQKLEKLRSAKVDGADRGKLEDLIKAADTKLRDRMAKALDDVAALTLGREGREASGSPRPSATGSPDVKASLSADIQSKIDAVVKTAIADMAKIETDAETAAAALPSFEPGKPTGGPGGKPSDAPGGRPSDAPARPSPTR